MMERARAIDRMRGICSRKECCRKEIMAKLLKLEIEDPEGAVEQLCKENYINEVRYASAFARDKSALQGWGPLKIRLSLQAKGIPPETVAEALGEVDEDAAEAKLRALLCAKLRTLSREADPQKRYAKLLRFALGRGYNYDQIKKAYDHIRTN